MTVHVLIWRLDMPGRARCTVCGAVWQRPKGTSGAAELADFEARHQHPHPALFDFEDLEAGSVETVVVDGR